MKTSFIELEPLSGEPITDCFYQATAKCVRDEVEVRFTHNDRLYKITPEDISKIFINQHLDFFKKE